MKASLILILTLVSIFCLGQQKNTKRPFVLNGKIHGRDTGLIVLWYPDTADIYIKDTTRLHQGVFQFSGWLIEPSYVHLIGSNRDGNYANFYLEYGCQKIILEENNFDKVKMSGSVTQNENESLQKQIYKSEKRIIRLNGEYNNKQNISEERKKYLTQQIGLLNKKNKELRITFIKKHPDSYVSPTEFLSQVGFFSLNFADSLFTAFTEKIKNSRAGVLCKKEIDKKKQISSGAIITNFSIKDINEKNFRLSQFKGKYVLLDFWASWCIPCRKEIPYLKEIYSKYHEKGFEIIAISDDQSKTKWINAVTEENIDIWVNILGNKETRMIFQAVKVLPTQLLLDPIGKIIWSSLEDNQKSWEELLNENLK